MSNAMKPKVIVSFTATGMQSVNVVAGSDADEKAAAAILEKIQFSLDTAAAILEGKPLESDPTVISKSR